jgi:hypothetical protein
MDADYATWVFMEMTRTPNQAHNFPQYARHIVGIMKNIPQDVSFGDLFMNWCRLILVKNWNKIDDYPLILLNMTSDILYLPRAVTLLEDPAYRASLEAKLLIMPTVRNPDLVAELLREFDFAVSRHKDEKQGQKVVDSI